MLYSSTMRKNLTITIITIIVLAIFGGMVAWYVTSHTSSANVPGATVATSTSTTTATTSAAISTADWPTCRNEKYGYEFKYPKGWYVYGSYSRNPPQVEGATLCDQGMVIHISPTPVTVLDTVYQSKQEFTVSSENQGDMSQPCNSVYTCRELALQVTPSIPPIQKETIVDGEIVLWTGDLEGNTGITTEFFHNGTMFTAHSQMSNYKLHSTILSTFRFIPK